jgi:hypothetical protein
MDVDDSDLADMPANYMEREIISLRSRLRQNREAVQKVRDEMADFSKGRALRFVHGTQWEHAIPEWLAALDEVLKEET